MLQPKAILRKLPNKNRLKPAGTKPEIKIKLPITDTSMNASRNALMILWNGAFTAIRYPINISPKKKSG